MARSRRQKHPTARVLILLLAAAMTVFALAEAYRIVRTDSVRLQLARRFGWVDQAELTRLIGRRIERGLAAAGVPRDSVTQTVDERGVTRVSYRIGLAAGASTLQLNYSLTHALEEGGAAVLSGRESWDRGNTETVTLVAGLPNRPTHRITIVRPAVSSEPGAAPSPRLALVLFGFRDDAASADSFFALPTPFAVAVVAGGSNSEAVLRAAHEREREVVLLLPLEPINYPRVNPGPGALLVSMKPSRIASEVRHYVDEAKPVCAVGNHMGSLATQDMTVMTAVYRALRNRALPFVHVMPAAGAVCRSLASEMGVAYDEPDAVLDMEPRASDAKALDKRWRAVLKELQNRGSMVVWVRATPTSYRWLGRALDRKRLKDVDLVPLTALIRKPAPA